MGNTKSVIPRYYALWRRMWSGIMSGLYPAGSLLGTEAQIAEEYAVSRITVRQALALLEEEGLVDRKRSLGTFVAENVTPRGVVEFTGYLEDILLQAESTATAEFDRIEVDADETVALELGLPPGTPVVRVRRLRVAAEQPRLWLVDYLPVDIGRAVTDDQLSQQSIMALIDGDPATRLTSGRQAITARLADDEVASRLSIKVGDPVLSSERVVYGPDGRALEYSRMYYPGERFTFSVRLGRI